MRRHVHIVNELIGQALLSAQIPPRERMIIQNMSYQSPIVPENGHVPPHKGHLTIVEKLQRLLLIVSQVCVVDRLFQITDRLGRVMVYIFEFLAEFFRLLNSYLEKFLMITP